jgi:hypothetical protein
MSKRLGSVSPWLRFLSILLFLCLFAVRAPAQTPLGTAFTYQGQLQNTGAPENGSCDLQFKLFDAATGGNQVGSTITDTGITITNGLFTVTLDFGIGSFSGSARWLEIAVACPSGSGLTTLSPRQEMTPSPNALFASSAVVSTDSTLMGNGIGATPLGIAPQGVNTSQLADSSVTPAKISASGSSSGQVLTSNGSTVSWQTTGGLGSVSHDATLTGNGTAGTPLGVAIPLALSNNSFASLITGTNSGSGRAFSGTSGSGNAVYGLSQSASGIAPAFGTGVWGDSTSGYGVFGTSATLDGVVGASNSAGDGVYGYTISGFAGVDGRNQGATGVTYGVFASNSSATANAAGVHGESNGQGGTIGVEGICSGSVVASACTGVVGRGFGTGGSFSTALTSGTGVFAASPCVQPFGGCTAWAIYGQGDFGGTGAKYFVEPHPTDPSKEIRFVCLEGPESGTYFRGTARIVNGSAEIPIPESFRLVTSEKGITVQVTPIGEAAILFCEKRSLGQILIRGSRDVEFDYLVHGIRKAYEDLEPIADNRDFVPRSAGDPDFGKGLPAESLRRLKANGILNPDGSINQQTAHRLGWDEHPGWVSRE